MTSSLSGFYTAQRSVMVNQAALNIINNNISNINTEGYSKQRLELSQKTLIGAYNTYSDLINAAQSGAGAVIDNITRSRDSFIDSYLRKENSSYSYYYEYKQSTGLIEDALNEISDDNLTAALNEFYEAAQQLNLTPSDSVTRSNFIQESLDVTTKFNKIYTQLTDLRTSLVGNGVDPLTLSTSKITTTCTDLNSKLEAIANLNKTINLSSSQGMTPNGLLDQRDQLLDEISQYIPITVTEGSNNMVNVKIGNVDLIKGFSQIGEFQTSLGNTSNPAVVGIYDTDGNPMITDASSLLTTGKIGALLDLGGSDPNKFAINNYITDLNNLAVNFAQQVNTIQNAGQYIDTTVSPPVLSPVALAPFDIFVENSAATTANYANLNAGNITINQDIINDPFKIAAASAASAANETGDGANALALAQSRDTSILALSNQTVESFLNSLNGKLGIEISNIDNNYDSQGTIVNQITQKREASSGVNLDEELSDLIKFQRSYEASAKVLTAMDKALQTIIGLVN